MISKLSYIAIMSTKARKGAKPTKERRREDYIPDISITGQRAAKSDIETYDTPSGKRHRSNPPITELFRQGMLAKGNHGLNLHLYQAACKYFRDWYQGGLSGGPVQCDLTSEIRHVQAAQDHMELMSFGEQARKRHMLAHAYVKAGSLLRSAQMLQVLDRLILQETFIDAGLATRITGIKGQSRSSGAIMGLLQEALTLLGIHYGIIRMPVTAK
jgi:hypothetical protein